MDLTVHIETFDLEGAAGFLHMNPEVVRRKVVGGEIPAAKTGKGWVFVNVDLVAYIRSRYPDKRQTPQGSENEEESKCHSENAAASGTSISSRRTEREYEKALEQQKGGKRRSTTTN